jgi:hypothetical protein
MSADEGTAFIGDSRTYLPVLGVSQFGQGPVDMAVFVAIYEIICKINHMLLVDSYFCPQEDSGKMCILSAFTEDTDKIARTALEDEPVSDHQSYLLHTALRALLQAYLPTHTAKEWRRLYRVGEGNGGKNGEAGSNTRNPQCTEGRVSSAGRHQGGWPRHPKKGATVGVSSCSFNLSASRLANSGSSGPFGSLLFNSAIESICRGISCRKGFWLSEVVTPIVGGWPRWLPACILCWVRRRENMCYNLLNHVGGWSSSPIWVERVTS